MAKVWRLKHNPLINQHGNGLLMRPRGGRWHCWSTGYAICNGFGLLCQFHPVIRHWHTPPREEKYKTAPKFGICLAINHSNVFGIPFLQNVLA